MFGSLVSSFTGDAAAFRSKLIMYIIIGIVAIVIISALLDGIKKYIRGLDTAALGALFIWLGYESNKIALVKSLSDLLYLAGGTLAVTGVILFIITRILRRKRNIRAARARQKEAENDQKIRAMLQSSEKAQKDAE